MVEAKLYLATCVLYKNTTRALGILEKAQLELENISCSYHPLSAKLSYLNVFIYHRIGNIELTQYHITATLQKVQSCHDKAHPWLAELYFQLIVLSKNDQKKLEQYKVMCRDMYEKLIKQESAQSKLFKVEDDVKKIIKSWEEKLTSII